MSNEESIRQFPKFSVIVGDAWLRDNDRNNVEYIFQRVFWFKQLEEDLHLLNRQVPEADLISCYRDALRDRLQVQKTIYEVHGAAFVSSVATRTELHVSRGDNSGRNFDVRVNIQDTVISAESKTRKDEFPFNLPCTDGIHAGARATLDPHDARDLGIDPTPHVPGVLEIRNPESTVIRQCLLEGLGQLPYDSCNVILFGHIEGGRHNVEDALFGTEVLELGRNLQNGEVIPRWVRTPTGAFSAGDAGEPFLPLSAVLWMRLSHGFDDSLMRAYRLYLNPNASHPLPDGVRDTLVRAIEERSTVEEEN
jgi:hypothetical protein